MIWAKMANEWKITDSTLFTEISLNELPDTIQLLKKGRHLGRTVVDITKQYSLKISIDRE